MAKAGYCAQCSANVWVAEDGSCMNGHPASAVSNVYETDTPPPAPTPRPAPYPPQPVAVPPAPAKSKKTLWIVLAVVLVLGCCLCGVIGWAILMFRSASTSTNQSACFANQRQMTGAYEMYLASETGAEPVTVTDYASLLRAIVPSFIPQEPKCPNGGNYSVTSQDSGIRITCSVDGSYQGEPLPSP